MTTTHRIIRIVLLTGVFACIVWLWAIAPAQSDDVTPSPSPSASVSPSPTPEPPASTAVVKAALKQKAKLRGDYADWHRAKHCFLGTVRDSWGTHKHLRYLTPPRSASEQTWREAGTRWRLEAKDYRARFAELWKQMDSTRGTGALRWAPLVKWYWHCGNALAWTMCHISWHECGGAPFRYNFAGSGAFGIWQLLPKPSGVWRPWTQARAAHAMYVVYGLRPWNGCAAFSCSGNCGIK